MTWLFCMVFLTLLVVLSSSVVFYLFGFIFSLWFTLLFWQYCLSSPVVSHSSCLVYSFSQELGTLGAYVGLLLNNSSLVVSGILVKLALPPFHSWFVTLLASFPGPVFVWVNSLAKLIPSFVLLQSSFSSLLILVIVMLSSLIIFSSSFSLRFLLTASSWFNMSWLIVSLEWAGVSMFIIVYLISIWFVLPSDDIFLYSHWLPLLILLGLPPSIIFFIKLLGVTHSSYSVALILFLVVWVILPVLAYCNSIIVSVLVFSRISVGVNWVVFSLSILVVILIFTVQ